MTATPVFADAWFWIGSLNALDPWHASAITAGASVAGRPLVTTDLVMAEVLAAFSRTSLRVAAGDLVAQLAEEPGMRLIRLDTTLWARGLARYRRHRDKAWSLVDCVSMEAMATAKIGDVLSNDHHFSQAGFRVIDGT